MDQPFLPPSTEPPAPGKPSPREEKIRRSALILSWGAMVVGAGLLYFFVSRGGFGDLISDLSPRELPWPLGQMLKIRPEAPAILGMAAALLALLLARRRLSGPALALGLIAVSIIGGWAAVLYWLLMGVIRSTAG